jgi:hypothetical protein
VIDQKQLRFDAACAVFSLLVFFFISLVALFQHAEIFGRDFVRIFFVVLALGILATILFALKTYFSVIYGIFKNRPLASGTVPARDSGSLSSDGQQR